jgi:hypothetical protein
MMKRVEKQRERREGERENGERQQLSDQCSRKIPATTVFTNTCCLHFQIHNTVQQVAQLMKSTSRLPISGYITPVKEKSLMCTHSA